MRDKKTVGIHKCDTDKSDAMATRLYIYYPPLDFVQMIILKSRGGGGAAEIDVPSVDMFVNNMNVKIPYKLFINGMFKQFSPYFQDMPISFWSCARYPVEFVTNFLSQVSLLIAYPANLLTLSILTMSQLSVKSMKPALMMLE